MAPYWRQGGRMIVSPEKDGTMAVRLTQSLEEGKGVASALYEKAIEYAKSQGATEITSDPEGGSKNNVAGIWKKLGAQEQPGVGEKKGEVRWRLPLGSTQPKISHEVHEVIGSYEKIWPRTWDRFSSTASPYGRVEGRIKTLASMQGKVDQKGTKPSEMGDVLGMRCTTKTVDQVYSTVDHLKKQFKVLELDDKMPKGQGFYRAVHLAVDSLDDTGNKVAEIQVRTERQSNIADWGHDIAYKGKFAKEPEVQKYAKAVSDAAWELDNGREAEFPNPPALLKEHGLQYDPEKNYYPHWVAKEMPEFV